MHITVNGLQIHYTLDGPATAPVVTMSHSLATDLSMWEPQMPALAPRYRVLRYDTRGHGGTDAPTGPYALETLADDVRRGAVPVAVRGPGDGARRGGAGEGRQL